MAGWSHGGVVAWRGGRMAGWSHGGVVAWRGGRMAGWSHGGVVAWRGGRMAGWSHGGVVAWRGGRMAGFHCTSPSTMTYRFVEIKMCESMRVISQISLITCFRLS